MNSNAILPILLELLAKSVAILAAAGVLHCALHRASAAKRYYVWAGAFAALLLLPLTKAVPPVWPLSWQKPRPVQLAAPAPIPGLALPSVPYSAAPASITPAKVEAKRLDWRGIAISAWLAGGLSILVYQLMGRIGLAVLNRRSTSLEDPRIIALMQSAVEEAAVKKPISLRIAEGVSVPCTWGSFRPTLLLPKECSEWNDAQLLAVLRHELAHIARHDCLARRLAQLAIALYWPNPLAWLAGATLRTTQEQACDDRVLRHGTSATDYAVLLFESVRTLPRQRIATEQALAMARPSSLESRIVAIVDEMRDRRPGGVFALLGIIAFVATTLTISAIAQVEDAGPSSKRSVPQTEESPGAGRADRKASRKADSIIIPSIKLRKATLRETVDYLRRRSVELDPEKEGINFVLRFSDKDPEMKTPMTLDLTSVSLTEVIKYVADLANVRWRFEPNAVVFISRSDGSNAVLLYREYRLPPGALIPDSQAGNADRPDIRSVFIRHGVKFPEGASAVYIPSRGRLIVRNTEENLDLVEQLVENVTKTANKTAPVEVQVPANKLDTIIIPRLEFRVVKLAEAIEFLSKRIRDLDPEKKGVSLELAWRPEVEQPPITISLANIPAWEALKYVTNLSGAKFRFESEDRIVIEPLNTLSLITKQYRVPANSISTKEGIVKGPDGIMYASPHEFFTAFGVTFPAGASAGLPVSGDTIVMRNTQENLELSEEIVSTLIEAKGGKLPDEKLKELRNTIEDMKAFSR